VNTSQQHPNLFLTGAAAKQAPVQTSSGQAGSELNPPTNFSSLRGLFTTCEAIVRKAIVRKAIVREAQLAVRDIQLAEGRRSGVEVMPASNCRS
jgi:hypothetical protein